MNAHEKLVILKQILADMGSVLVAFSGGVDSTFLLRIAHDVLGSRAMAVTASSELYPERELEEAQCLAGQIGGTHLVIKTNELETECFAENPPNRCYYCKKELFGTLLELAAEQEMHWVADGATRDDLSDHRPGSQAARELGVRSPLQEAGMTKDEIRLLSRELELSTWDKPSMACLASRFPYGSPITPTRLERVAEAEDFLREIGFTQLRVRDHGDIARLEVPRAEHSRATEPAVTRAIVDKLTSLGFSYVTLDLQGYRTGSLNEVLTEVSSEELSGSGKES